MKGSKKVKQQILELSKRRVLILSSRKKLSNFSHNMDWTKDINNYVAKRYMEEVGEE